MAEPTNAVVAPARTFVRWALVLGGYAGAALVAGAAVAVRQATVDPAAAAAAGGMYAAGDTMLYLGVFGAASLAPTALLFYFLRDTPRIWAGLVGVSLAIAATAPLAIVDYAIDGSLVQALSVLRLIASPLVAVGFALCALVCPAAAARSRRTLLVAAAVEGAVALLVVARFSIALVLGR